MAWWHQTDQFDWFSSYLRDRGLQRQWRLATASFTVFLGLLPLVMLGSPLGPNSTVTAAVAVAAAVAAVGASTLWLFRWPTRTQSVCFGLVCSASTAATSLALSSPYAGLMGCTVFAVIGGFLAYFHAVTHVVVNFCVSMTCAAITAGRLVADTGDISLLVAAILPVVALNVGVPFGIHSLVHSLRIDLKNSDRDPLTGLLNRRSFYNAVHELTTVARSSSGVRLNVTMVDLDRFKTLNDTRGHAVGDQALVRVGTVLAQTCGPGAALARLGGEEFVIADTDTADNHAGTAERIRAGIASSGFEVTASLGTCSAAVAPGASIAHPEFVDRLIRLADAAMYEAKRAGGNRIQHRHLYHQGA